MSNQCIHLHIHTHICIHTLAQTDKLRLTMTTNSINRHLSCLIDVSLPLVNGHLDSYH